MDVHPIQMYSAIGESLSPPIVPDFREPHSVTSEIKFGSLFDHVVQDPQTYLATGEHPSFLACAPS
jgi:hypothetical protein